MHTALRRGKYFKSTGRLKPFCTVDFPHSGKEAKIKQNKTNKKKKTKTIREVHESNGNATVMRHPVSRTSTGPVVTAGEGGSSGYRGLFSNLLRQHKSIKKRKPKPG